MTTEMAPSPQPTPLPPVIPCNTDDDCEDDQHCQCSHGALRRGLLFGNAVDEDCTCKVYMPLQETKKTGPTKDLPRDAPRRTFCPHIALVTMRDILGFHPAC